MIKANLWFTNLSTTEQSPDASYRLSNLVVGRFANFRFSVRFGL